MKKPEENNLVDNVVFYQKKGIISYIATFQACGNWMVTMMQKGTLGMTKTSTTRMLYTDYYSAIKRAKKPTSSI